MDAAFALDRPGYQTIGFPKDLPNIRGVETG